MQTKDFYKNVLSDIIKEHMVLFDPFIALAIVHSISAIRYGEDGTVYEITGNHEEVFTEVKDAYTAFGGDISRDTIATILAAYPPLK